jgi:hypothetical protein
MFRLLTNWPPLRQNCPCSRVDCRADALLVFGPKKLPELGKGIGAGIRALKGGSTIRSSSQERV